MAAQPSKTILHGTIADLTAHAPFDQMDRALLESLAAKLTLCYYPKGATILAPGEGRVTRLFIVQHGAVSGVGLPESGAAAETENTLTLIDGEMFPLGALISQRPAVLTFVAAKDTFCYKLDASDFEHVMDVSRPFRHFATRRLAHLLDQSRRDTQAKFGLRVAQTHSLATSLRSLLRRAPISVPPSTTIRDALNLMHRERIGSIVVRDDAQRPIGIFTERDVVDRVALSMIDQSRPIADVMTPNPVVLTGQATVFEAAQLMAQRRFRHIVVVDEEKLAGVVSERDLFSMQRLSLGGVAKAVDLAEDVDALARAAADVRSMTSTLIAQGVSAEQLTNFVTTLNDAIVGRALALAAREHAPPSNAWCWLGLGSEGRSEQTLATDQDNAIIFAYDGDDLETVRAQYLAFARVANHILDRAGFPLCKGEIMAMNPKWCLSTNEWQATFAEWLRAGNPQALLNAAIFFDFRALHGDHALAESLRKWLSQAVPNQPLFLRLMAQNALQVRPPLGMLRDFVDDDSEYPNTIDLKKFAARPFVDVARILALRQGLGTSNTAERLRMVAPHIRMAEEEVDAFIDAFHFVQLLRLRQNEEARSAATLAIDVIDSENGQSVDPDNPNRIWIDRLNELDRRILKEALRQARKLQARLEMDYRL